LIPAKGKVRELQHKQRSEVHDHAAGTAITEALEQKRCLKEAAFFFVSI